MNEPSHIRPSGPSMLSFLVPRALMPRALMPRALTPRALMLPLMLAPLFSVPCSLHGQDGQAYQALYAASDRYYNLETLCAHFNQVVEVTLLGQTRVSEGTVCLRQPDLFSMRFADPEGGRIVVDGEFAWNFFPDQDPRQVIKLEGAEGGFNFFENILADPRGRFEAVHEGREPMGERMSHKIALTPREDAGSRSVDFRSAVVWLDVNNYMITALDMHDTSERIRRLRFSNIRLDVDIPDEVFRFVLPEGARVFTDPRGAGSPRE